MLRILGIPIYEIKLIFKDNSLFIDTVRRNISQFENERRKIDLAEQICEEMIRNELLFESLDSQLYLDIIEKDLDQESIKKIFKEDYSDNDEKAWQRYFARYIDLGMYAIILWIILFQFFSFDYFQWIDESFESHITGGIVLGYVPIIAMLLIEPILLTSLGTTLGKCIMRVRITHKQGRYLSYIESLKRTWLMFIYGMGLGIPFYDLYCNYKSYCILEKEDILLWEKESESKTEIFSMNIVSVFLFIALIIGLSFFR